MGVARRESNNQEQTEDKMISRTEVFLLATAILGVRGSGHDNFCRDLTDYGDLTTVDEEVNVCSYEMKKDCPETTESHCMEVTELECDVELFTDCTIDWTKHEVKESMPATLTKTLPTCTKEFRTEKHEKTHYDCHMVTKQHCTTLWEIVNGKKVWAGNDDDCRDVTWEECNPVTVEVEWEVPFMNCTDNEYPYVSYENTTTEVMADTMDCEVLKRPVCRPRKMNKCSSITFQTCSEKPVETCKPKTVPCPSKDKIHRQWCLFGQGEQPSAGPSPTSSSSLKPSGNSRLNPSSKTTNVVTNTDTDVKGDKKQGYFQGDLRDVEEDY